MGGQSLRKSYEEVHTDRPNTSMRDENEDFATNHTAGRLDKVVSLFIQYKTPANAVLRDRRCTSLRILRSTFADMAQWRIGRQE